MSAWLYEGRVRHRRETPAVHDFGYRVYMTALDLDALPGALSGRLLWSATRPAPLRFRREDHFGDPREPLAASVRRLVAERTGRVPAGRLLLLTNLRHFGYVFNPVSFVYCHAADGALDAIVAEVANTPWNERHLYVLDARRRPPVHGWYHVDQPKEFHVSPFMGMDATYRFRLTAPGERLGVQIASERDGAPYFRATMGLRRRPARGRELARVLARYPFMTLKVVAAIHVEALRLWAKGVRYVPHPGRGPSGGKVPAPAPGSGA